MSDFICRPARTEDLRFVVKTWIDSFKGSKTSGILQLSPFVLSCECGAPIHYDFNAVMSATITRILGRSGVEIMVASNPRGGERTDLHGYIVIERSPQVPVYRPPLFELERVSSSLVLVHYVFVKKVYRNLGLARALFKSVGVNPEEHFLYSCSTPLSIQIEKNWKIPRAEWAPHCARFTKETSKVHDPEAERTAIQPPRAGADPSERPSGYHEVRGRGRGPLLR